MSRLVLIIVVFGLVGCVAKGQSSRHTIESFESKGKTLKYGIQYPKNFDASKTYPVAIGPSDPEKDGQSFYWNGTKDTQGWILIDYKIYQSTGYKDEVIALFNHLGKKIHIEGRKFHTVCFSANSAGIFDLVMEIPDYFQSITGMAGNPSRKTNQEYESLKSLKVRFIVGDKDNYWMNSAIDRNKRLQEAGVDSSIFIVKDGKHVLEDYIGEKFIAHLQLLR